MATSLTRKRRYAALLLGAALLLTIAAPGSARGAATEAPPPFLPIPSKAQIDWQRQEYAMFIHYGLKTYYPSADHKGSGKESPKAFNPVRFDAKQWAAAAKAGGFAGIVLTTKHHGGFCNWQTDTTDYSVKSTPWKDGKGDVVAEVAEACREAGLTFGLYASIWDQNYEHSGRPREEYGAFYFAQLKELSTRYGKIDEYWFDGFGSKHTKVDWAGVAEMIKTHQPHAVVYDSFTLRHHLPDRSLRWPGRHGGVRDPSWSRQEVDGKMIWYPAEASLILQGNWFHNRRPMVGLNKIKNYYLRTVGCNALPLMNVAPNADGLIDEASVKGLKVFKSWVDAMHAADLTRKKSVTATADSTWGDDAAFAAANVIDGNYDTYYAAADGATSAVVEVTLALPEDITGFILQEYIPLGQRISAYSIDCMVDGEWVEVFAGQTIGYKRILVEGLADAHKVNFPVTDRVRLRIKDALATPVINTFSVLGDIQAAQKSLGEWRIDSAEEWQENAAESVGFELADGQARLSDMKGNFRSVLRTFPGKKKATLLTLAQSAAWDNWKPIAKVGPKGARDAPIFLPIADGNYWFFAEKPALGKGYHAWHSTDLKTWNHKGVAWPKRWATTAEYADGKIYLYVDKPNDQDPHLVLGENLSGTPKWTVVGKVLEDPSHGSDSGAIRTEDGMFHLVYEDWSPINASKHSWDSPLAGHADSPDGITGFAYGDNPPAIDVRTTPTGKKGTYGHSFTSKEPLEYEIHEPEQDAYGDYTLIQVGERYYLFSDYHPADGQIRIACHASEAMNQPFERVSSFGNVHPDPTVGYAEGQFYLITQRGPDYVSPGPWVDTVEARVGVDQDGDGEVDHWTDWQEVRERYERKPGFARLVDTSPAALDLTTLPEGYGFRFDVRIQGAEPDAAAPVLDHVTMTFQ